VRITVVTLTGIWGWRGGSDFEQAAATTKASTKPHTARIRPEHSFGSVRVGMLTDESD
jgi:hypothetical protein